MLKRDVIKRLQALGYRSAEKQGAGRVHLSHLKYADLVRMLAEVTNGEM
jgi:hypothetical protein